MQRRERLKDVSASLPARSKTEIVYSPSGSGSSPGPARLLDPVQSSLPRCRVMQLAEFIFHVEPRRLVRYRQGAEIGDTIRIGKKNEGRKDVRRISRWAPAHEGSARSSSGFRAFFCEQETEKIASKAKTMNTTFLTIARMDFKRRRKD